MGIVVAQLAGLGLFITITIVAGILVRRAGRPESAESLSRVSHLGFWIGLVLPWTIGVFFPGGAELDSVLGLEGPELPAAVRFGFGVATVAVGVVLMQLSINGLKRHGSGAPALKLTRSVVDSGVYSRVRNPMALGFYTGLVGGALLCGSTYVAAYTVAIIAAHVFNLKYFEESELAMRYGESYERYRDSTPFLVPRMSARNVRA